MRGSIGFSTHKNKILSRIIRWFTNHPYSHTFIVADVVGERPQRVYLLDAFKREASFNSMKMYLGPDTAVEIWTPKDPYTIQHIDSALNRVEDEFLKKPYSLAAILGIAIKVAFQKKLGWIIGNPLHLGVYCGQMVYQYLIQLGMGKHLEDAGLLDPGAVSPGDLYIIVTKSGLFEKSFTKDFEEEC